MSERKTVVLALTKAEAERFSHGISDIACIIQGIEIAKPKTASLFLGRDQIRDLNIKLKQAIKESEDREAI